jgi:hypothetical protein
MSMLVLYSECVCARQTLVAVRVKIGYKILRLVAEGEKSDGAISSN